MPSAPRTEIRDILDICKETSCKLRSLPGMYQLVNGEVSVSKLRDVEVEDLLGREPIRVDLDSILSYVQNKVVMVTGGGGSIGSELCRQVASHKPAHLVIVDIYENNAYDIQQELLQNFPELKLTVLIASVRNTKRINSILRRTGRILSTMRQRISMCRSWRSAPMRRLRTTYSEPGKRRRPPL